MVVSEVTDALKTVGDGLVTGALDRGSAALVTAFALDRGLLATAGPEPLSPGELIAAVRSQGVEWLLVGPDQPLRPLSAQ